MTLRIHVTTVLLALAFLIGTEAVGQEKRAKATGVVRIGGVAYKPSKVTIFQNLTTYLNRKSFPAEFVLYSDYDKLNAALDRGEVDIAWNGPGHHARFHVRNGGSQSLGMRDVDQDRVTLVVRADSNIKSVKDLQGKRLMLGDSGSQKGAPGHFLKKEGVDFANVKLVRLDSSASRATDVLKALSEGRSDAAVILESAWKRAQGFRRANPAIQAVWNSPEICHCTFTAAQKFDASLGSRFTRIITSMDPKDPLVAELNRLEGAQKWLPGNPKGFEVLVASLAAEDGSAGKTQKETPQKRERKARPKDVVLIGGYARTPNHVTIFKNLTTYLNRKGFKSDFVLYSNYKSVIDALDRGEVDIAWQSPVPHAMYHLRAGGSKTLAMRNVDRGLRVTLVARADSKIKSVKDLAGRRLILGSSYNAEGALLPVHYLKKEGVDIDALKIVSLHKKQDADGKRARHLQARAAGVEQRPRRCRRRAGTGLAGRKGLPQGESGDHPDLEVARILPLHLHSPERL